MRSCTPNCIMNCKSRYLIVKEEIINPKPSPIPAISKIKKGNRSTIEFISTLYPLKNTCISKTTIKRSSWTPNFKMFEIMTEIGTVSLGK